MQTIIPVILCGGSGTRLWPLSRDAYPKQFHSFVGHNTLFEDTVLRSVALSSVGAVNSVAVVCNEQHRFLAASQAQRVTDIPANITLEPIARNTAAAIAAVAHQYAHLNDAILVVLPSDHYLPDIANFTYLVSVAVKVAMAGKLCTFGIVPTAPETGYGYIESGAPFAKVKGAFELKQFVEKPNAVRAAELLANGGYTWNSGMFVMKVSTFLNELETHAPAVYAATRQAVKQATQEACFTRLSKTAFETSPCISVDYAVLEKTQRAAVVPFNGQWSDLGSWSAVAELAVQHPVSGGVSQFSIAAQRNFVHACKPVALMGVDDLVVVDTPDALLIAHKASSQQVKDVLIHIKESHPKLATTHRKVHCPWGWYDSIDSGEGNPGFQVKRIHVYSGHSICLQSHLHRAEHWVVVQGTATIGVGKSLSSVTENDYIPGQHVYIPFEVIHRLTNRTNAVVEIIEVQCGSYLGEDDIVLYEDVYGRV